MNPIKWNTRNYTVKRIEKTVEIPYGKHYKIKLSETFKENGEMLWNGAIAHLIGDVTTGNLVSRHMYSGENNREEMISDLKKEADGYKIVSFGLSLTGDLVSKTWAKK